MQEHTDKVSSEQILAKVTASKGRRIFGVGTLGLLGFLCIWLGFSTNPAVLWRAFLVFMGVFVLIAAVRMYRATGSGLVLTETELRDLDGTLVATVADIQGIDRGTFAFKPSNGFLLKLHSAPPATWRPGLWWRVGRRVGVGGMTAASQTKMMADMIAVQVSEK